MFFYLEMLFFMRIYFLLKTNLIQFLWTITVFQMISSMIMSCQHTSHLLLLVQMASLVYKFLLIIKGNHLGLENYLHTCRIITALFLLLHQIVSLPIQFLLFCLMQSYSSHTMVRTKNNNTRQNSSDLRDMEKIIV